MRLRLQGWKRVADERRMTAANRLARGLRREVGFPCKFETLQYELTLGTMAGAKPPISVYWREARRESPANAGLPVIHLWREVC
jgi:hypothetical protein